MSFEELDKKIKEAAERHHPAYDEKAWEKMEKLLHKHLPTEKKDRRRIAFWIFLFLLAGGGALYYLTDKPRQEKANTFPGVENTKGPVQEYSTENKKQDLPENTNGGTRSSEKEKQVAVSSDDQQDKINNKNNAAPNETPTGSRSLPLINQPPLIMKSRKNRAALLPDGPNANLHLKGDITETGITDKPKDTDIKTYNDNQKSKTNPDPSVNMSASGKPVDAKTVQQTDLNKPEEKTAEAEKKKEEDANRQTKNEQTKKIREQKKGTGFFISLSAGPDAGATNIKNIGKLKLAYGAGIGYNFNGRFSVQTGFYSSRKIYTAAPDDYHAPGWWWAYYPNLLKVDADCRVTEIPLLFTHHFNKAPANRKKGNWFITYGLSSYLMKKENYKYHYKTSSGIYQTRSWSTGNENKHLFSVINLAGGYQKKISNNISFSAMPYLKIPWQGVGFGKVKLNSGGILISAGIHPFTKR